LKETDSTSSKADKNRFLSPTYSRQADFVRPKNRAREIAAVGTSSFTTHGTLYVGSVVRSARKPASHCRLGCSLAVARAPSRAIRGRILYLTSVLRIIATRVISCRSHRARRFLHLLYIRALSIEVVADKRAAAAGRKREMRDHSAAFNPLPPDLAASLRRGSRFKVSGFGKGGEGGGFKVSGSIGLCARSSYRESNLI